MHVYLMTCKCIAGMQKKALQLQIFGFVIRVIGVVTALLLAPNNVIVIFEDSSSTTYPTIDYAVRNETFTFTIHIRVLHRRDFPDNTTSRDRLRILYRIVRHILETNSLSQFSLIFTICYPRNQIDQ